MHRIFFGTAAELDDRAREIRAAACARAVTRSEGLLEAWDRAGLRNPDVTRLTISMDFACFEDFFAPLQGKDGPFAQYFASLGPQHQAVLKKRVEAAYLNGSPDGPRSQLSPAWAVKGTVP